MGYKLEKQYRLKGYNYSANGWYFMTICTNKLKLFFGVIRNEKIQLSKIGKTVDQFWKDIPNQFPFVKLDTYQIMPNHIHGIIVIQQNPCRNMINHVPTEKTENMDDFVHTFEDNFINESKNPKKLKSSVKNNPMELKSISLGRIIRWHKGRSTFEINKLYPETNFKWQLRYHDRIIRDEEELERIREYIRNNPAQWESDNNYKKNKKK